MDYTVQKLGPVKDVCIKLRPLTVVCGKNNTGKSYITYSLYTLLEFMKTQLCDVFDGDKSRSFLQTGECSVNLNDIILRYNLLGKSEELLCKFKETLPRQLLLEKSTFEESFFNLTLDGKDEELLDKEIKSRHFNFPIKLTSEYTVRFIKRSGQTILRLILEPTVQPDIDIVARHEAAKPFLPASGNILKQIIPLVNIVISSFSINNFIITCERTGVATFRPELSLLRDFVYNAGQDKANRFSDLKSQSEFKGYSLPIEKELEFALHIPSLLKRESSDDIVLREIMPFFEEIASGSYVSKDNTDSVIYYRPLRTDIHLPMSVSSSSVRTLSELFFYLKFKAKVGQTLMIDEPELNLHPSAQRKMARLFARLVNCGINVFITTHSDYLIRELNALMSMSNIPEHRRSSFLKEHDYQENDLLTRDKVGCYVLDDGVVTEAEYNSAYGFAVESFDDTILQFNKLYNDLHSLKEEDEDARD